MMFLRSLCFLNLFNLVAVRASFTPPILEWGTKTPEPTLNSHSMPIVGGGMPIGNGKVLGYVFAVDPVDGPTTISPSFILPAGVSFMVDMPEAMASDASLFSLGMVSLDTVPSMFTNEDWRLNFHQYLNASEGSVTVSTARASVKVWIEATTNMIAVSITSAEPVELLVQIQSLRPVDKRFFYAGEDLSTLNINASFPTSNPDNFFIDEMKTTLTVSHRNVPADQPAYFNDTLQQQGLGHLIEMLSSSDHWSNRQFGMAISGNNLVVNETKKKITKNGTKNGIAKYCLQSNQMSTEFTFVVSAHANQTKSNEEFQQQLDAVHHNHTALREPSAEHVKEWSEFWSRSHVVVSQSSNNSNNSNSSNNGFTQSGSNSDSDSANLDTLSLKYALTRYLQTIQVKGGVGGWIPIKFNGLGFTTQLPPTNSSSGPTFKAWGPNSWWQNTRLPYGNMLTSGDYEDYTNILEFILQMVPFAQQRTMAYFNHTGIFFTETKTLFGSYRPADYGDYFNDRVLNVSVPYQYELNSYLRYDFGGDGGTTEAAFMVLDYYDSTNDLDALERYAPIILDTLDFFSQHYQLREINPKTGKDMMKIFPTQALETYWCAWQNSTDTKNGTWIPPNDDNCMSNDHPTVVSLHVLVEKSKRCLHGTKIWTNKIAAILQKLENILPPIPLVIDSDGIERVSPFSNYPNISNVHNVETPELYGVHPFRYYTQGRAMMSNIDVQPALQCMINSSRVTCKNGHANSGWTQGIMIAALLGLKDLSKKMILERALTPPATGYRFVGFAPAMQDYEPSADHYANLNTALQWMILQPADDNASSMILFGAWPCDWDVDFKLHGPKNTIVEGILKNGKLLSLQVTPSTREKDVINVLKC